MKIKFKELPLKYKYIGEGKYKDKTIKYEISILIHGINNYLLTCIHDNDKKEKWQYVYLDGAKNDAQEHWDYHVNIWKKNGI